MTGFRISLPIVVLCGLTLAAAMAGCAQHTTSSKRLVAEQTVASTAKPAQPVAGNIGKELFLERCASCHNERGDKPLRTGLPLNQRKLSREVITAAVKGRLKSRTEAEQRAVVDYIASLYVGEK